jgi:hypothetical protein
MVALVISFFFYTTNVVIGNMRNLQTAYSLTGLSGTIKMFGLFIVSFADTMPRFMYVAMIVISVLTGALSSLLVYKHRINTGTSRTSTRTLTGTSFFLGVLAPGCTSCGLGLIAWLGLGSSVAFLPFKGNEVALLAIGMLSLSISTTSNQIDKDVTCTVSTTNSLKGGLYYGKRKASKRDDHD